MKKRKLFYFVLAVMAMSITLLCACVGVKDPPPDPSGETVRAEIFVPVASVSLKVGDKRNLNACIQNADTEEELTGGTLAYASSDPQSVSVSESGELTALKTCQNVIVTVSGTYDGDPLESEEVPVTVTEEMSVSTNIENNFLTLYTSEGRDSENPFTTSYELHPTVVVSGKTVEDADIEVVSSDPQIVKAENTRLTALKAGNVTVTITATSAAGTRAIATVEISVSKPVSQITFADEPVVDVEKGVDWTSFGIDGVPVSLGIEGVDVTYEFESGRLTLDNSPVVGDNLDFRIELEDEILETKITVATMTISSVEDLKDFADKYKDFNDAAKTPVSPYVVLTADIDMPEADKGYLQDKTSNGGGAWRGTLDGKGHTINNLTLWHGFMGQIAAEGVVKNLAVTNMVKDNRPTGIISQECRGTIENCYFQGITVGEQPDRWYVPFISILHHGASVKNVVLNMTSRPADGRNTIMDTYDTATIENLFVIVRGGSGKLTDKDAFNQNGGVYTDVNAFKETAERNLQTFGGYWTTEPGTLIFKSAVKYFTPENGDGKTITSDGDILIGGNTVLKTNFDAIRWSLKEEIDGVQIQNGVLSVGENVADGTKVTVCAVGYDLVLGTEYQVESEEFTITEEALEKQEKSLGEILIGKNRADYNYEIEIGSGESLFKVTIDGEPVDFTVESGKVLLSSAMLKGYGVNAIHEVNVVTTTSTTITTYVCELRVWDFAVGTVDEWIEFEHAKDSNHSKETPLYVVLTADLDFGGDYEPSRTDSDSWYSLDGKGHTIQNVSVSASHSFLGDVRGTADQRAYVRNVIFKNLTQKDGHGGLLCLDAEYCDFENLYIEGTILTTNSTLVAGIVGRDVNWSGSQNFTFRNVVINVTFANEGKFNAVVAGDRMTLENVYAISSTSNGNLGGVSGEHTGLYGTVDDFRAAIENITLGDAWTLTETDLKLFGKTVLILVEEEALEKQEKSLDEILVGKNRTDDNYEIEIGSGESTIEVTINGKPVDFTVENGKVLLSSAMLKGYAVNAIHEINVVTITTTTITTYACKLSVWDFAVGTVDEWIEFEHAKDSNHSKETPLYVVLTADLDFGGDYEPSRTDSDSWYSLDGKGHTIQNVSVSASHSFLGDVRGTADQRAYVRNVIFKNLTQKDGHGGLLCLDAEYCDFENLYIEGTILTTNSTLVAGIVGRDVNWSGSQNFTFRNVVINVTFANEGKFNAVVAGDRMTLENVYAISSTSNGNLGGVSGEHTGLYGTVDDFRAAIENITLGDAWTLTETDLKLYGKTVLIFETVS
ncbi:MAG: hypothetical protein ACI4ST_04045 [Candidatus Gallimonas sp.]